MTDELPQISHQIWDMKYRFKAADGTPIDQTMNDTWRRVAKALAAAEDGVFNRTHWEKQFYDIMVSREFSPAGRIISGAGTGRAVTLANCYTMGTIPDSMDGIFSHLKEAALTMQQGGGIGYDFSTIRPMGSEVKGVAADASGPLSFMDVWDSMCRTIMSAGSRRGAMMATMRCDHPDIEAFIEAKRDPARLRMFNLSVLVTDAFMGAVKEDAPWRLHFENRHGETISEKTIKARDLWDRIMGNTYAFAEPGVIFIDRVNADHNIGYIETIATTNPCAEKPMGPYASCLLGSINLAMLVRNAFTEASWIDMDRLEEVVETAIRAMDNVIEVSNYPLEAQMLKAKSDRQLGLGVTGLADALIMCGLTYGSEAAVAWTDRVMALIAEAAYNTSLGLAIEKGSFQTFDADEFLKAPRFAGRMLPVSLKSEIAKYGIRNALLLSIAPTGTISLYAGNVSSGIEPVFALSYVRKVLQDDGSKREEIVEDYAVAAYREFWNDNSDGFSNWSNDLLPDYFVTSQNLSPEAHLAMTGIVQKWVDSSISKTINLPEDITFEDFKSVYLRAYELGCKGCTTYRPNDVTGSVLSVTEAPKKEVVPLVGEIVARPDALDGATYKIKWPLSDHAIYVTISDIVENGQRRPFEVFINSKNMEHFAWTVALTRMISAVFRRPHDSRFVAEELKAVFDPKGGAWVEGKYIPSVLAAIGGVIERHMIAIGYIAETRAAMVDDGGHEVEVSEPRKGGEMCPKCFSGNVKHEAGCFQCIDCGHSKCG
jgi:ribonucleoside-diphosphate reductase alpha chain